MATKPKTPTQPIVKPLVHKREVIGMICDVKKIPNVIPLYILGCVASALLAGLIYKCVINV